MTKECRTHKRYVVNGLKAGLREEHLFGLASKPTSQEYPCLDISEGGLQFVTKHKFDPQSRILLDITIPTTRNYPIRVKARVAWFKLSGDFSSVLVGAQFVSIAKRHLAELKVMIERIGRERKQIPSNTKLNESSLLVRA